MRHLVNAGKTNPKRTQTNPKRTQNEPKLKKAKMNVTSIITKGYENKSNWAICENEPKTNPIKVADAPWRANKMPKQTQLKPIKANIMPKQTQFKPKQTQFQRCQMQDTAEIWMPSQQLEDRSTESARSRKKRFVPRTQAIKRK